MAFLVPVLTTRDNLSLVVVFVDPTRLPRAFAWFLVLPCIVQSKSLTVLFLGKLRVNFWSFSINHNSIFVFFVIFTAVSIVSAVEVVRGIRGDRVCASSLPISRRVLRVDLTTLKIVII
jgi:hypothetical protein